VWDILDDEDDDDDDDDKEELEDDVRDDLDDDEELDDVDLLDDDVLDGRDDDVDVLEDDAWEDEVIWENLGEGVAALCFCFPLSVLLGEKKSCIVLCRKELSRMALTVSTMLRSWARVFT